MPHRCCGQRDSHGKAQPVAYVRQQAHVFLFFKKAACRPFLQGDEFSEKSAVDGPLKAFDPLLAPDDAHPNRRPLVGWPDDQREANGVGSSSIQAAHIGRCPLCTRQHLHGRPCKAQLTHQFFLPGFVHTYLAGADAAARVGDAQLCQLRLQLAVFAILTVQCEKGNVHEARQLCGRKVAAYVAGHLLLLLGTQGAQAFYVDLEAACRGGQCGYGRIKIADAALV